VLASVTDEAQWLPWWARPSSAAGASTSRSTTPASKGKQAPWPARLQRTLHQEDRDRPRLRPSWFATSRSNAGIPIRRWCTPSSPPGRSRAIGRCPRGRRRQDGQHL